MLYTGTYAGTIKELVLLYAIGLIVLSGFSLHIFCGLDGSEYHCTDPTQSKVLSASLYLLFRKITTCLFGSMPMALSTIADVLPVLSVHSYFAKKS